MAENLHRESARIYQFPIRNRSTIATRKMPRQEGELAPAQYAECGGGWYHEAAIREAAQARKS